MSVAKVDGFPQVYVGVCVCDCVVCCVCVVVVAGGMCMYKLLVCVQPLYISSPSNIVV